MGMVLLCGVIPLLGMTVSELSQNWLREYPVYVRLTSETMDTGWVRLEPNQAMPINVGDKKFLLQSRGVVNLQMLKEVK